MYAMQYEITLPADYDMGIIRERVATKGHLLDDFPGLGLKAYLIRERGRDGSLVNQYAPFYLWATTEGMSRFLWGGGGFGALAGSFGRPAVQTWAGIGARRGPAFGATPKVASRSLELLPPDVDPQKFAERAAPEMAERASQPGVCVAACGINPARWQLMRVTLWENAAPNDQELRYEILHLCRPELESIASVRDRLEPASVGA